jgi:hypothetical protein
MSCAILFDTHENEGAANDYQGIKNTESTERI